MRATLLTQEVCVVDKLFFAPFDSVSTILFLLLALRKMRAATSPDGELLE